MVSPSLTVAIGVRTGIGPASMPAKISPRNKGFIVRDGLGWVTARLAEVVQSSHDASTMSADQVVTRWASRPTS